MIVCVIGPTGVGKTKLSEKLSKKYDGIIVNNDAMQVYKEMNIGTAKYTSDEDLGQPHYLFDIVSPKDNYTVYDYQKDARKIIEENKGRNIIMVGGTGLYLKSALFDYEFSSRETNDYEEYTNEELYEMLEEQGRLTEDVHVNNRRRLVSKLNSTPNNNGKNKILYDDVVFIGLTTPRDNLYERLNARVDVMLEEGLLDEVSALYKKYGLTKALRTAISYKEVIIYLRGLVTYDEMVRILKKNNRNYAKRQYTWFNHQMDVKWFDVNYEDFNKTIHEVYNYIENLKLAK